MHNEQTVMVITAAGGPEVLESRQRPVPTNC
jgi:hypothetical protein